MCEKEKGYNGWTNYETWAVKLWIDNDQGSQEYWLDQARRSKSIYDLSEQLKNEHNEQDPLENASVFSDLLNAALSEVNWYEIAEALTEEAKELDKYKEK